MELGFQNVLPMCTVPSNWDGVRMALTPGCVHAGLEDWTGSPPGVLLQPLILLAPSPPSTPSQTSETKELPNGGAEKPEMFWGHHTLSRALCWVGCAVVSCWAGGEFCGMHQSRVRPLSACPQPVSPLPASPGVPHSVPHGAETE